MAPIVKSLPSHINDSQHALGIFHDFNFFGEKKIYFYHGHKIAYTVIPNDEGLLALKHFFDQHVVKEPCSETLLHLAKLSAVLHSVILSANKLTV